MLQKTRTFLTNISIHKKLVLIFLCIGILPFLAYVSFTNYYSHNLVMERELSLAQKLLKQARLQIEREFLQYNTLLNQVYNDSSFRRALNTNYGQDYYQMYQVYRDTLVPRLNFFYICPSLMDITVYSSSDLLPHGSYVQNLELLYARPWFTPDHPYYHEWILQEEQGKTYLYYIHQLTPAIKNQFTNYLYMKLDFEVLISPLSETLPDNYAAFIVDEGGSLIFSQPALSQEEINSLLLRSADSSLPLLKDSLSYPSWTLYFYTPQETLDTHIDSITSIFVFLGCIILVFLGITALLLSMSVIRPIKMLTAQIQEAQDGSITYNSIHLAHSVRMRSVFCFGNFPA